MIPILVVSLIPAVVSCALLGATLSLGRKRS
jgi:hypothetical protein